MQDRRNSKDILGSFEIVDKAVSTSGDYEKFFIMNGERYSHIIDPRTGTPVKGVISVTIVAGNATMADAFSTGVFVMGVEEGLKFIENKPGVEGIIVYEDSNANLIVKTSSGMRSLLQDDSKRSYKVSKSDIIIKGSQGSR